MAVYVDALIDYGWHLGKSCHLVADSEQELHEFARLIGCKRSWFQQGKLPHYDLTRYYREAAIARGAGEIDRRGIVRMMRERRGIREQAI